MKILGIALCIVNLVGGSAWAVVPLEELHLRHGNVTGQQTFERGVVDWAAGVALVSGSSPVPSSSLPVDHLRAKREARIALWANVVALACELTASSSFRDEEIPRTFFREASVIEYRENGSYVLKAAIPLKRLVNYAEERP